MGIIIGKALREHRRKAGITLRDIAARMGVGNSYICLVERGARKISLVTAKQWADAIGMPVEVALEAAIADQLDAAGLEYEVRLVERG